MVGRLGFAGRAGRHPPVQPLADHRCAGNRVRAAGRADALSPGPGPANPDAEPAHRHAHSQPGRRPGQCADAGNEPRKRAVVHSGVSDGGSGADLCHRGRDRGRRRPLGQRAHGHAHGTADSCPDPGSAGDHRCTEVEYRMIMHRLKVGFHRLGSPPTFHKLCRVLSPWLWAGFLGCALVGLYQALYVVPPDYQQGDSYRILFIHVPAAWQALASYLIMAVLAVIALVWRIRTVEIMAMAAAPVGAALTALCLATGSLWGKPMWGT